MDMNTPSPLQQYLQQIGQIPALTDAEKAALPIQAARQNPQALRRIQNAHLALAAQIAEPYPVSDLEKLFLLEQGNTALEQAVQDFPWYNDTPISSFERYARTQVRTRLIREFRWLLQNAHPDPRSASIILAVSRLKKRLGRNPTVQYLSEELNIPVPELTAHLEEASARKAQLQAYDLFIEREKLRVALDLLTEREAEVIEYRFGLTSGKAHTLDDVSAIFGVSRERIRQIESKALRKLRGATRPEKPIRRYLSGLSSNPDNFPEAEEVSIEESE